jgi:membrane associated rhomboid family serine protease
MSSHGTNAATTDNPFLNLYENFHRETPFISRTIITTQVVSWTLSFFVDLTFSLANIPVFTVRHFEVHRIFTSVFLCTNLMSLAFATFSILETGKRLENSIGSTEFAFLFLSIGFLTNVLYIAVGAFLDGLFGMQHFFVLPSFGVWLVLFGLTSFECIKAPQGTTRRIFLVTVPILYYPLVLLGLFSLFGGFSLAYLISVTVGYAYGFKILEWLKISSSTCRAWEESFLESLTSNEGWILAISGLGSGAWTEDIANHGISGGGGVTGIVSEWTAQAQHQTQPHDGYALPMGSEDSRPGRVIKTTPTSPTTDIATTSSISTTGGRQLGGPSRRTHSDPRQARLNAIERRMGGAATNDANAAV